MAEDTNGLAEALRVVAADIEAGNPPATGLVVLAFADNGKTTEVWTLRLGESATKATTIAVMEMAKHGLLTAHMEQDE